MLNTEKIRLMAQLAIMEKEKGKELREVRESFRSDYIGIPMLKNAIRITVLYLTVLVILTVVWSKFVLNMVAYGKIGKLAIGCGIAYLVLLLITLIITYLEAAYRYEKSYLDMQEYQEKLKQLTELDQN